MGKGLCELGETETEVRERGEEESCNLTFGRALLQI